MVTIVKREETSIRNIASLIIPQTCALFCNLLISLTDVWVAGQLGADVQASFGIIVQINLLLFTLVLALSSGAVAAVSQSLGANRIVRVRRYVTLLLLLTLLLSFVMMVPGFIFQETFLRLAKTPESIFSVAKDFLQISLLTLPAQYLLLMSTAIFRAAKLVRISLVVTVCVAIINVFGDFAFGLGYFGMPAYGAVGIAWSTFGAISAGAFLLLLGLARRQWFCLQSIPPLRWMRKALPYVAKVALPAFGTSVFWNLGYFIMFVIVASLPFAPVAALAGLTAGMRLEGVITVPAVACSMSVAVLVGFSLGAGRLDEARRITKIVLLGCVGAMSLCGMVLWIFRQEVSAFMSPDLAVQQEMITYLSYNLLALPFSISGLIMIGVLNGAGATIYSLVGFCISIWGIRLPLAYLLGHVLSFGAEGVYMAMLVSQIVKAIYLMYIYSTKPWAQHAMRAQVHA